MEGSESVLEAIYEEETLEDLDEDIDMIDAETLESDWREQIAFSKLTNDDGGGEDKTMNSESGSQSNRKRMAKRKPKATRPILNVQDPGKFVLDSCRHLKEKKLHLVRTAVDCLGVSAIGDLIKEPFSSKCRNSYG
ncbi:uncharacterized protein LOC143846128 isoform X2 [Tasmannia lanceolata]|uniref:uncharacterized protein LOC143846128 isoform X2 n=1 Tax=Tasmannia lanceolata TaxID=3420 RepID=UPI004064925E